MTEEPKVPVLICGGGPVGLALAIELGLRGVDCVLAEQVGGPHLLESYEVSASPSPLAASAFPARPTQHKSIAKQIKGGNIFAQPIGTAAAARGVPLKIVDIENRDVAALYERKLVLVRPDGHVASRADASPDDAFALIDRVRGHIEP
jgi:flavin-dependent dehydrogenase